MQARTALVRSAWTAKCGTMRLQTFVPVSAGPAGPAACRHTAQAQRQGALPAPVFMPEQPLTPLVHKHSCCALAGAETACIESASLLSRSQEDMHAVAVEGDRARDLRRWGACYFQTFMRTMQREWFGIDRLRLDKFLLLVRRFVRPLFAHLRPATGAPATHWHHSS